MADTQKTMTRRAVPFTHQTQDAQTLLIRGIAHQILKLNFPKLEAINFHFKKVGLCVQSIDQFETTIEAINTTVKAQGDAFEQLAIRAMDAESMITQIKMILVSVGSTMDQKVEAIRKIVGASVASQ